MKRVFFYSLILLSVLISCSKPEPKDEAFSSKKIIENQKFQSKVFQKKDKSSYYVVFVNTLNGEIYVWNSNQKAFKAANHSKLPSYKTPVYSIDMIENSKDEPTIILTNNKEKSVYVYEIGVGSAFDDVSGELKTVQ